MKNIILLGAPRSGKTTLAKMIMEKYPQYQLIEADAYYHAYIDSVNKLKLRFSQEYLDNIVDSIYYCKKELQPQLSYIVDCWKTSLDKALEYQIEGDIVLVFGYPDINLDTLCKKILKFREKGDWINDYNNNQIRILLDNYLKLSKTQQKECDKLGLKYINTSFNREKVLKDVFKWLEKELV